MNQFDPNIEGTCLLYDAVHKKTLIGSSPIGKTENLNEAKNAMGYLAYPNPNLKNQIPDRLFYEYEKIEETTSEPPAPTGQYSTSGELEQEFSKEQYLKKIAEIKELLAAGEVYQINFAIRFRKKFDGDPYVLFQDLISKNPTAFSAYLNCGDFQIISNSPERLFKIEDQKITTEPIKGTAPKGQREQLLASEKERAELDMITDLERNDIGKICEYGTLKLTKERELMELKNLWHTYSQVQAKLRPDIKIEEVIEAMFPGGSITGCPKLRAMSYIEQLEGAPRNIYTGSIGYLKLRALSDEPREKELTAHSSQLTADFNICIRTALIKDGYIEYWAGGGIVADSEPESEYAECFLKGERFFDIISS